MKTRKLYHILSVVSLYHTNRVPKGINSLAILVGYNTLATIIINSPSKALIQTTPFMDEVLSEMSSEAPVTVQLYLVRHGETVANRDNILVRNGDYEPLHDDRLVNFV